MKIFESNGANRNLMSDEEKIERHQIEFVKDDWRNIRRIPNPSERVQLAAVEVSYKAIEFIKNPGERVQLAAIRQNPYEVILIMRNKGIKIIGHAAQTIAVKHNPYNIRLIKNPSLEIQLAAVQRDGNAILWFDGPIPLEVQIEAVKQDGGAIKYIPNPSPELFDHPQVKHAVIRFLLTKLNDVLLVESYIEYLIEHRVNWPEIPRIMKATERKSLDESGTPNQMSEEEQVERVRKNWRDIENIPNPSERVQLVAVQRWGLAIKYIQNPSERVQLAAVQNLPASIHHIPNPSEKVQLAAVTQDPMSIISIRNPTEKVQLTVILLDANQLTSIRRLIPSIFNDEQAKKSILLSLLTDLKEQRTDELRSKIEMLRDHRVNWPELDRIESAIFRK